MKFHVRATNDETKTFVEMGIQNKEEILQALSLGYDSWQSEDLDGMKVGDFTAWEVGLPIWLEITRIS